MNDNEIGALKNRAIYMEMLQNTEGCYSVERSDVIFTYEPNKCDLDELSSYYDFQTLVGTNETETFINAVNWVTSKLMPKTQSNDTAIYEENSAGIIKSAAEEIYIPNCYANAVVLNDVFRLLGYKARYIFCLPIDYHVTDNHVVNLVYSKVEKRWMLFDAAQNLYYSDENNNIIDIWELRKRLICAKPIQVCFLPIIWDGIDMKDHIRCSEKVLTYMSKNLYRFACFANCQRDRLSKGKITELIHLVPTSYIRTPFCHKYYRKEAQVLFLDKYISNADEFWAAPVL